MKPYSKTTDNQDTNSCTDLNTKRTHTIYQGPKLLEKKAQHYFKKRPKITKTIAW